MTWSGRSSHGSPFTVGDESFRVPTQPEEGCRWLQQESVERKVLNVLCDQMSSLGDDEIAGLSLLITLFLLKHSYYLDTRYPNRHSPPTIPADMYSSVKALEAKEHAENIYSIIVTLFGSFMIINVEILQ